MIGLDTNVVVRLVTADDPEQAERARQRLRGEELWLPKTVLLECEWVLRSAYGLSRDSVVSTFRALLGYPQIRLEDRETVLRALEALAAGLDFADALHLASSSAAERLVTFDRQFGEAASRLGLRPTVEPL